MPSLHILILEAADSDADLIAHAVRGCGVEARIDRVVDRAGFVAALRDGAFRIVVADLQAHGFKGHEAVDLARASNPDTPVIYLSRVDGEVAAVEAMKAGATDYLLKSRLDLLPNAVLQAADAAAGGRRPRGTEAQLHTLVGELRHRLKNTLAAVSALNWLTRRNSETIEQFHAAFTGRIEALSYANELLFETAWRPAELGLVLDRALKPFVAGAGSIIFAGGGVEVSPRHALGLTLVMHELATNAVKYGALSRDQGRVTVAWTAPADAQKQIVIHWTETGGPPVGPPQRRGFGSTLIARTVADELGGTVETRYPARGLTCTIAFHEDTAVGEPDLRAMQELGA